VPDVWYYANQGQEVGPFSLCELQGALASRPNPTDVLVWTVGLSDWKKASEVPELRSLPLRPPPLPASPASKRDGRHRARRVKSIAKGAVLGALVGFLSLVLSGAFWCFHIKGNLAEPEFAGYYSGYLVPTIVLGIIVGFIAGGRGSAPAGGSWLGTVLFISVAVILALVSAAKIAADFPGARGCFIRRGHPCRRE
jgi:GYF domain 2